MQKWNAPKNEKRQYIYASQNVKSHWLQAVHPGHFLAPLKMTPLMKISYLGWWSEK